MAARSHNRTMSESERECARKWAEKVRRAAECPTGRPPLTEQEGSSLVRMESPGLETVGLTAHALSSTVRRQAPGGGDLARQTSDWVERSGAREEALRDRFAAAELSQAHTRSKSRSSSSRCWPSLRMQLPEDAVEASKRYRPWRHGRSVTGLASSSANGLRSRS